MARDKIPFSDLGYANDPEIGYAVETPLVFNTTSNMYIANDDSDDALWIRFNISAASTSDWISILAGDGHRSGLGDYTWTSLDGNTTSVLLFGPIETARFKLLKDTSATIKGSILVDCGCGGDGGHQKLAGTVTGYKSR